MSNQSDHVTCHHISQWNWVCLWLFLRFAINCFDPWWSSFWIVVLSLYMRCSFNWKKSEIWQSFNYYNILNTRQKCCLQRKIFLVQMDSAYDGIYYIIKNSLLWQSFMKMTYLPTSENSIQMCKKQYVNDIF